MNNKLKIFLWAIGTIWVISLFSGSNNSIQSAQSINASDSSTVQEEIAPSEEYSVPSTDIEDPSEDTYDDSSSYDSSSDDSETEDTSDSGLSNDDTYINSNGNEIHSPAYSENNSVPEGASAQCNDGEYSFSQHRSGTCSRHGGVATWL
jgi:hypothetical protein